MSIMLTVLSRKLLSHPCPSCSWIAAPAKNLIIQWQKKYIIGGSCHVSDSMDFFFTDCTDVLDVVFHVRNESCQLEVISQMTWCLVS